jgi:hypothetical protein
MQGIDSADTELKKVHAGSVYKDKLEGTMAQTLVNLRIVKGTEKESVLVIGFDVAVAVQEQSDKSDKVSAGVGVPLLSVIGLKGGIEGQSGQTQTSSNTSRITFSVPLSFEKHNSQNGVSGNPGAVQGIGHERKRNDAS